ncbi:MAG: transposase zinc-binding domain-containing protein [Myxococcota bacterium]
MRHRPQDTVLSRVVEDHLDEFLRTAREQHGGFPAFIEKTFRAYLNCGRPERGCIRVHCDSCGHDDVVAFSCKRRGVCPSCNARTMADGAAHLVDHVLPRVPLRQWVVSFPFDLNGMLAFQPELLVAVERIVVDALRRWLEERAGGGKAGGVFIRHRFGGAVNINMHSHLLILDGVYREDAGGKHTFTRTAAPTTTDLLALAGAIHRRVVTLLRRRGLLKRTDDEGSNDEMQLDALGACTRVAMAPGQRERSGPALSVVHEDEVERPRGGCTARVEGFDVYASDAIDGEDRETLERVARYLLL